jgi:hypothetical protein
MAQCIAGIGVCVQASEHRGGLVHTLREIVAREGLAALWKGATANVAYALIGAGLLVAYDRAVAQARRQKTESKKGSEVM